ncbi:hypothetical protein DPMN_045365 [Dreissena polymorpha]|uniref:HAT C-terminal dimerisation domain-containing protein n=1 Tax=Dreissena polymorpha TaxID=45954 RepID=A0A9D4D690_DREPO|nr:hypothetical protein DPMN_045365 [Dreissena polymorpha]
MQGTSVPSEKIFSTAGDPVSAHRDCLDPGNVDMLIFVKANIILMNSEKGILTSKVLSE